MGKICFFCKPNASRRFDLIFDQCDNTHPAMILHQHHWQSPEASFPFSTFYVDHITQGRKHAMTAPPPPAHLPTFQLHQRLLFLVPILGASCCSSSLCFCSFSPWRTHVPLQGNARQYALYQGNLQLLPFLHSSFPDPIPRPPWPQYNFCPNKSDHHVCICVTDRCLFHLKACHCQDRKDRICLRHPLHCVPCVVWHLRHYWKNEGPAIPPLP